MRGFQRLAAIKRSTSPMTEALHMPEGETVMVRLIRATVAGMGEFFEPVFRQLGLTENAFHVLCLLVAAEDGRLSPSDLSDLVGTSRANMTKIIEGLAAEGLVTRRTVEHDGRRQLIEITAKGRHTAIKAVPAVSQPLRQAFSGLSAGEFKMLDALLRKAVLSFDQYARPLRASA
jgi:MarR family transcriptional repressor of emrRAB